MNNQIEQFRRELALSSGGKKHLEERGFTQETLDQFKIGYCPACSNYGFDLLNGRIVLPIEDVYGEFLAFAGRRLDHYSTDVKNYYQNKTDNYHGLDKFLKWKTSKWINTPYSKSSHLFNLNRAKKKITEYGFCFLVEGYYDVMRLYELGFENTVALCGTSLTNRQCDLIYRYCETIVVMLDGDDAGKTATNRTVTRARSKRIYANIIELPDNMDPDDLTKEDMQAIFDEVVQAEEEIYIKL
jgi:DNA primase